MAGSALIGNLAVTLGLETAAFQKGATLADKQANALKGKMEGVAKGLVGIGAKLSVALTAPFSALMASSIPAAVESQQAIAQVNAALASMGPVAGRSAEQLQAMAGKLQSLSNFDDDDILKSVTANLLTFGNVSGQAFDRAQLAAVNLSARLGQDLQASAIQVGKALNDPVKGVTALGRVGVSFTAQQKEQIAAMTAAGNAAGAQAIILGELEKQFGGAAEAQRAATPDAALQEQWRTLQETLGALALKVLPPLTSMLTGLVTAFNEMSPGMQTFIVGAAAITAALGPVLLGVGGLVSGFGAMLPLLVKLAPAFAALASIVETAVIAAMVGLNVSLGGLILVVGAVAAAVAGVYLAWKNWDKITAIARQVYEGVKAWISDKLTSVFTAVTDKVKAVGDAFYTLWDRVVGHSYVPDLVEDVGEWFQELDPRMVQPAVAMTDQVAEAFAGLGEGINRSLASSLTNFKGFKSLLKGVLSEIMRAVEEMAFQKIGGTSGGLGGLISKGFGALFGLKTPIPSGAGGFGGPVPNMPPMFGGFRAAGGPVVPGKSYVVGEEGPEWFTPSRTGSITPNGGDGGGRWIIEPSPWFDVRAAEAAEPAIGAMGVRAAAGGSEMAQQRMGRQRRQTLGYGR